MFNASIVAFKLARDCLKHRPTTPTYITCNTTETTANGPQQRRDTIDKTNMCRLGQDKHKKVTD